MESKKLVIVYNGKKDIEVMRDKIGESCFYFKTLLNGDFKESCQSRIDIKLNDFSFEAFQGVVNFANGGTFTVPEASIGVYVEMIQLAALWLYDELVENLESYLIDNVTIDSLVNVHTLANVLKLDRLKAKCSRIEYDVQVGTIEKRWGRCPLPGHESHHYSSCPLQTVDPDNEDWNADE